MCEVMEKDQDCKFNEEKELIKQFKNKVTQTRVKKKEIMGVILNLLICNHLITN